MKLPTIKQLPSGSYRAQVQINGKRISVTRDTKKEVELEIMALHLSNVKATTPKTLYQCINEYIEAECNVLSPSTVRGYRNIQKNRFQSVMNRRIDKVANWQQIVNEESKLVAAKTLKNAWGFVRTVLEQNNVDVGRVRLPMIINKERNYLSPSDIKKFIDVVKGDRYELSYLICLHGLRASEMLALNKEDITADVIRVNKSIVPNAEHKFVLKNVTKNATSTRDVPVMIPRLRELAEAAPDGRLTTVCALTLNRHLKTLCNDNNLPVVTLHELRHSYVTLMYHRGISEEQAMSFGGYSDFQTMHKIYLHLPNEDRKRAADNLVSFFT